MRIDSFLVSKGYFKSREKSALAIKNGEVTYNGKIVKPSFNVEDDSLIQIKPAKENFVSMGGFKLQKAIRDFNLSVDGLTFLDVGASTGGFTDCLLKNGANKVFCLDVGESQLDKILLTKNVVVLDNFNARNLQKETLGELVDGVVCDVSFISLTYVLEPIKRVLKENGFCLLLIKPQFECGKEYLGNSGIVKSKSARESAIVKIYDYALSLNLIPVALTVAPIREKKNEEYIIMLKNQQVKPFFKEKIKDTVNLQEIIL